MELIHYLMLFFGALGISNFLAVSKLANDFKKKIKKRYKESKNYWIAKKFIYMLNCHTCNGFWSGIVAYVLFYFEIYVILFGFSVLFFSPLMYDITSYIDLSVEKLRDNDYIELDQKENDEHQNS